MTAAARTAAPDNPVITPIIPVQTTGGNPAVGQVVEQG